MKSIFLILFSFVVVTAFGQSGSTIMPPKKANKIIVLIKDSSNTLLNRIAKALFEKGFTIDTKDEIAKTLSTKEYAPGHPSIFIKARASINDTSVIFTGTYAWTLTAGLRPQDYDLIEFRGMKNSAAMQSWNSLDAIARLFGDKIIYSR